jgi:CheY-like chemotaxis protein
MAPNMEAGKPLVFISYSTEDSDFADLVKMKLKEAGIDVWIDQDELDAGEEWRNEIDLGISNADALLLILTPASQRSPYVTYEWAYAIGRKKRVIPVLYKDTEMHPRLSVYQHLNFTQQRKGPWEVLIKQIKQASRKEQEPSTAPRSIGNMTETEFVRLMSGIISLASASAKNEGREAHQKDLSDAAMNMASANFNLDKSHTRPSTILWVDNHPENNRHEREAFEALGFKFDLVTSTEEAIRKKGSGRYSAIISDMVRPEGPIEGYVLLQKIREKDKATPYFIYANTNRPEDKREAARLGAQGFTNHPKELIDLVTRFVSAE